MDMEIGCESNMTVMFGAKRLRIHSKTSEMIWFSAYDMATILGHKNIGGAIIKHADRAYMSTFGDLMGDRCCADDKDGSHAEILQKIYPSIFLDEVGILFFVIHSKRPYQKKLRQWLLTDIIPRVRDVKMRQERARINMLEAKIAQRIEYSHTGLTAIQLAISAISRHDANPPTI